MKLHADVQNSNHSNRLPPPLLASEVATAVRTLSDRQAELKRRLADRDDAASRRELARVELALEWCHAGVYGRCSVCGSPLPTLALRSDPADLVCDSCRAHHCARSSSGAAMRTVSFTDGPAALHDAFVRARDAARVRDA